MYNSTEFWALVFLYMRLIHDALRALIFLYWLMLRQAIQATLFYHYRASLCPIHGIEMIR